MSFRRACLALLVCVAAAEAQGPKVEMRTLKGDIVPGELVGISKGEVVVNRPDGKLATPTPQVLLLDFPEAEKASLPDKYLDVELVDGSIFHCAAVAFKPKQISLTLASGQVIALPLIKVSNILTQAQDPKYRKEWSKFLSTKRKSDVLSILLKDVPNHLDVTIDSISEDGKTIHFTIDGEKKSKELAGVHGLVWDRAADPNMPLSICKLIDVAGSVVMIEDITLKGTDVEVMTPGGVKLTYPLKSIAKLDYNRDKLKYLSEMEWKVVKEPEGDRDWSKPWRDQTPEKTPLRLGSTTHAKGLFLSAYTELTFDLGGDFRELAMVAGIDTSVSGSKAPVTLIIDCDGREREKKTFTRDDKEPLAIKLNVKDVRQLRIVVTTEKDLPFGAHLTLADAKVMK
jgi:hypothetical protein